MVLNATKDFSIKIKDFKFERRFVWSSDVCPHFAVHVDQWVVSNGIPADKKASRLEHAVGFPNDFFMVCDMMHEITCIDEIKPLVGKRKLFCRANDSLF